VVAEELQLRAEYFAKCTDPYPPPSKASRDKIKSGRLSLSLEGNFELDAFRPVLISNYLHSALIMADMCDHFREFMIEGTRLNQAKLKENIDRSVMMVTALSPIIGYDKSAAISYYAIDHDQTLKQAAMANGVSEDLFDKVVIPIALTRPGTADVPSTPQPS